jgi:drug/metabolite transporter (DMT)-like permease
MMVGVMTIEGWRQWRSESGWKAAWLGSRQIVVALVLFALSSVIDKVLVTSQRTDPYIVLFYQHVIFVLVFGVYLYMRRGEAWKTTGDGVGGLVVGILVVALLTLGYRYFQLVASKQGSVAMVLAVKRTSIFWGALAGGYLFKEKALRPRLIGAALIIGAGFLILRVGG